MAIVEDFTPEFYRRNNIDTVEIALDTLHCNARCEFCYLPKTLAVANGNAGIPLYQSPEDSKLMGILVVS